MKCYNENKEQTYIQYFDINNLHRWVMLQKVPGSNFEWNEHTSQFNEDFITKL